MPEVFTGVGVALVTLFDDHGAVDASATADHAARLVDAGVRAVVVAGSTGEAATLDRDERCALLEAVRGRLDGAVPVVAGTGGVWAGEAVAFTRDARDAGADAVLTLSPPRVADPRPYYRAVADVAGDLPVLAYHFPAVSPPGIAIAALADLPVVGVKDSSGDAGRLLATLEAFDGDVHVGSAALLVQAGAIGCAGAILALANLEPAACVAAFAGDGDAQRAIAPLLEATADFPRGLKAALHERFGTSRAARMG